MMFKSIAFLSSLIAATSAYDIGCLLPEGQTDPWELRSKGSAWVVTNGLRKKKVETPMVVRQAHMITVCQATCLAYHTPGMLDPLSEEAPRFTVPAFGQNAFSIVMCAQQCSMWTLNDGSLGDPSSNIQPGFKEYMNGFGFSYETVADRPDVVASVAACPDRAKNGCGGGCARLCNLISRADYSPYVVGHVLGAWIMEYFDADGWNSRGDLQYSGDPDSPVPCTASCRAFQDTTGYAPQPDPRLFPELSTDTDKYNCTGRCRRWQPLQEGNAEGSLVQQEYVTPHIGKTAKTFLRNVTYTLEDPMIDYRTDSLEVIEEVKATSSDQTKKDQIQLMDDKLEVRRVIQKNIKDEFVYDNRQLSFQQFLMFLFGISTAEYDGVIQAWAEKTVHDLVRPTTVIKHWNEDILNTYGGKREANGPVDIAARDFEAFIRVMPHPEFPSGSSCLCTTYMEFTDAFLNDLYGSSITDFKDFNGYRYSDMMEYRDICGASRVWGGMHYPPAIPAGEEICSGLGTLAIDYYKMIQNNATFTNEFFGGDARPVCGSS